MTDRGQILNRWIFALAYAGLTFLLLLINIMPFELWPRKFPGPDLMVAVTFVWLLRRPMQIPAPLVATVFFIADVLLMRPIGLWAALMVMATEFLRRRQSRIRGRTFTAEWALASGVLLAATLANAAIISLAFLEQFQLSKAIIQTIATILAYPLVVAIARYAFRITAMTVSEADSRGQPG